MRKILLIVAGIVMVISPALVTADDPIDFQGQGNNNWQWESMPEDVKQQAAKQQQAAMTENEKKARAQRYDKCMADNGWVGNETYCNCVADGGVKLNTNVPFIGRCINKNDTQNAFPSLIGGISRMVVTAILIVSFMMIIVGWVMWTSGNAKGGKALIVKVVIGLAILGASGAILRLINPNFFK